jgi:hypothetical protein
MGHAITISTGKRCLVLLAFFIASWPCVIFAETSAQVNILKFQLTCDLVQCRTPVLEVHENTGMDANSVEYVFPAPPRITLDDAHTTGVEVDGGGDTHYVRALGAGPSWLKCMWLAKARLGGDTGLAKGYCWIGIKKQ